VLTNKFVRFVAPRNAHGVAATELRRRRDMMTMYETWNDNSNTRGQELAQRVSTSAGSNTRNTTLLSNPSSTNDLWSSVALAS